MKKKQETPEKKVLAFIRENGLVRRGDKVVAAVSGGPDSVCLLHILNSLKDELGIELHAAHLDHQLRGAEAKADADYVKGLARRWEIPATIESADVAGYKKKHRLTLEEAARETRYRFLAKTVQKTGAACAVTGHTASDNVETILMHLIRGSGVRGMRGLLPETVLNAGDSKLKIIRPLLALTRGETEAYCAAHRLKPRTDASNLSTEPFRNKIRRKLLPELQKYNPQIAEALLRTARTAKDDLDFIESGGRRIFNTTATVDKSAVIIDKKGFLTIHAALQRQVLRISIESLLGSLKDIEAGHIEEMMEALRKPAGKIIGLPSGLNFYTEDRRFIIANDSADTCPLPELEGEKKLVVPGVTFYGRWLIETSLVTPSREKDAGGFTACFDASAVGKNIMVRGYLPGDRFRPLGMAGEKKVNRLMIDEKVPQAWRKRVPIVCAGEDIIWVAGYRVGECCRVKPETKKVLRIEFKAPFAGGDLG